MGGPLGLSLPPGIKMPPDLTPKQQQELIQLLHLQQLQQLQQQQRAGQVPLDQQLSLIQQVRPSVSRRICFRLTSLLPLP